MAMVQHRVIAEMISDTLFFYLDMGLAQRGYEEQGRSLDRAWNQPPFYG